MMARKTVAKLVARKQSRPRETGDICDMPQLRRRLSDTRSFNVGTEWRAVGVADPP